MKDTDSPEFTSSPSARQLRHWGLDPSWSRRVTFTLANGTDVTWHVLDTGPGPLGTIVCVHGNPSWGYLWRDVLESLSPGWRVLAVDQTGMGYSQRPGPRRLDERVDELVRFCRHEVDGPLVLAAHDWGGPIAVSAAGLLETRALVLANTTVAKPDGVRVPPLIGIARALTRLVCERTPLFVDGAAAMTARAHRQALRAPYRSALQRAAVAEFVADIPVGPEDPSWESLAASASTLSSLECPILILWGGRDPVFHDRFLRDLRARVPRAKVERFENAGHYVPLDEPIGTVVGRWLDESVTPNHTDGESHESATPPADPVAQFRSVLNALAQRSRDSSLVYQGPDATMTWKELASRSSIAASALRRQGVGPGARVSLLIRPRAELLIAALATWKLGAIVVVADSSAGAVRLRRLVRAAAPDHVIGTPTSVGVAALARFAPGVRFAAFAALPGVTDLRVADDDATFLPVDLQPDDVAAIVHTSGATGPAKPVRYTHGALGAQRDVLAHLWRIDPTESFTTSFGAFMLLSPVIGMGFVRPDFDVDKPSELDFDTLSSCVQRDRVTTAWLSPACARTVVATSAGRHLPLALVMLAGAPISKNLVLAVQAVVDGEVRAPYGMTECLPVTDGTSPLRTGPLGGTSTGRALPGCVVEIDEIDGGWGEILVSAPWMFDGYDARWSADNSSIVARGLRRLHRTGDVGYLDDDVLFQLGRLQHVIRTSSGPSPSVAIEEPIATALDRDVAAVAVGAAGTSVIAVVVSDDVALHLAPHHLAQRVRDASSLPIAAVLCGRLPTDRRHESKVDRTHLAQLVQRFLAGR